MYYVKYWKVEKVIGVSKLKKLTCRLFYKSTSARDFANEVHSQNLFNDMGKL